jgi:hypothetical protein
MGKHCAMNTCPDGLGTAPVMNCVNLVDGAEYDFCNENIVIEEGPFMFFPWTNTIIAMMMLS